MLAKFLPDKLTPLTTAQAMLALRVAYAMVDGEHASPECLAIHTAQSALEAARWKSLHNFCFTNAKAGTTYQGLFSCYRCNEKLKDGWHWYVPEGELVGAFGTPLKTAPLPVPDGHPQTRFRAFANINAGALDHMQLVKRKWPEAWTAARGGDVAGFVHGLKMRTFFTADEAPYLKGVASMMREFLPLAKQPSAPLPDLPADDEQIRCEALACVAPDPERYLHTEAVLAVMSSMGGVWDAVREERNAAMREP
jgi:hypothetical protein